jgi:hypothetical protein
MEHEERLSKDISPVDTNKKKIVSLDVNNEEVHDGSKLRVMVDKAMELMMQKE